jgi:hypothetical protein
MNLMDNKEAVHAMKMCVVMKVQLHSFSTSALNGMEWSATRTECFTSLWCPGSRMQGSRAGFKALDNRIICCYCRESTHDLSDDDNSLIYMFRPHGIIIRLLSNNILKDIYIYCFVEFRSYHHKVTCIILSAF